jgi:GT2 family glycosyltransferase
MSSAAPVSVVVPTVGRPELLRACLRSLVDCEPPSAETIVIDQSDGDGVQRVVADFAGSGVRIVAQDAPNQPLALNRGLEEALHDIVLITDDDCTVAASWVGTALTHMTEDPEAIVTGRVLPSGDPLAVPSIIDDETAHDYTGELQYGALYGGNMACNRSLVLADGGFDERLNVGHDNDLCWRWLRAGRRLRFEPDLVVWHHAWRTARELDDQYFVYGHGQGLFYAKHLRGKDFAVARFLVRDLYRGARGIPATLLRGRSNWPDPRRGLLRGLIIGLVEGWRTFSPRRAGSDGRAPLRPRGEP